jgi:hypothetical protein
MSEGVLQWDRKYILNISDYKSYIKSEIRELDIEFEVENNSELFPNPASINIYNLNPTSRAQLEKEKLLRVDLSVGYGEDVGKIFEGDIIRAYSTRDDTTYKTTITAGDGIVALTEAVINIKYDKGHTTLQVLNHVIKRMGVVKGNISGFKSESVSKKHTYNGSAKEVLKRLTDKQNVQISIQGNSLQILKMREVSKEEGAIALTPASGLIGLPIKTDKGFNFKALIQPRAKVGNLVNIAGAFGSYDLKMNKITFKGSNFGGEWYMEVEGVESSG